MREERVSHKKDGEKIKSLYGRFFQDNRKIYLLAGELNPSFYEPLIKKYYHLMEDKTIHIICGPYISVKDELFQKYYNIHNNHLRNWWYAEEKGERWKIHPVFEAAYQNNNINIYIIKQRYEPHFALGLDTKDVFVEDPHDELSEDKVTIHFDDEKLLQQYIDTWDRIKNEKCYKWNKEPVRRLFKPVYKIKRELELQKKIREEFSCSMDSA